MQCHPKVGHSLIVKSKVSAGFQADIFIALYLVHWLSERSASATTLKALVALVDIVRPY